MAKFQEKFNKNCKCCISIEILQCYLVLGSFIIFYKKTHRTYNLLFVNLKTNES